MVQGVTRVKKTGDVQYEVCDLLQETGLIHGVTQRHGGVSEGPYESLNLALHVGDREEHVLENRRVLATAVLGTDAGRITVGEQVHGLTITQVTEDLVGSGAISMETAIPKSDAIHTNLPNVPLLLLVADCVPVLIYDTKHKAFAVVHAGWRGAVDFLPNLTLHAMKEAYNTKPAECIVYLGPSIGGASFEVGSEVVSQFKHALYMNGLSEEGIIRYITSYGGGASTFEDGKAHIDLREFLVRGLLKLGVKREWIVSSVVDTKEDDNYFSYRRDAGVTGRIGLFGMLKK